MLRKVGHNVHQATGQTALRVLEECPAPIGILITDVLMPGINGVEVSLAVLGKYPEISIVFMSGYGQEIMTRFPEAPNGIFIAKPFGLSELVRIVTTSLTSR